MLASPPRTLICDRRELAPVSIIGAYPKAIPRSDFAGFRRSGLGSLPQSCPSMFQSSESNVNFSSALLKGTTLITVFYREGNALCRGILFEYESGGQRAVGECRIGHDPYKIYTKPLFLCILKTTYLRPGTQLDHQASEVTFSCESSHNHENGWDCYEMSGVLNFWFTSEQYYLEVHPG